MTVKELIEKLRKIENQDLSVEIDLALYAMPRNDIKSPISIPGRAEYVFLERDTVYISTDLNWYAAGKIVHTSTPI